MLVLMMCGNMLVGFIFKLLSLLISLDKLYGVVYLEVEVDELSFDEFEYLRWFFFFLNID